MNRSFYILLSLVMFVVSGTFVLADDADADKERRARVQEVRTLIESLRVSKVTSKLKLAPAELAKEPALLYADNARNVATSALWVVLFEKAPIGLVTAEVHANGKRRTFEFASLSPDQLQLVSQQGQWQTAGAGFVGRNFPKQSDGGDVAETRPKRLQQMKRLADRFSAVQQHTVEGRLELRRLASPVYRLDDATANDGGLFVFATGTNPEVALWIATHKENGQSQWTYGLAPLCSERVSVLLDDREVWSEVRFTGPGTRKCYVNGHFIDSDQSHN